jgi:hypothetical protein
VFLKLLARYAPDTLAGASEDTLRRWALVLHGMALMTPDHHRGSERVGRALFGPGQTALYAEARLARLLGARGEQFRALVPRLCRHLKSKDQRVVGQFEVLLCIPSWNLGSSSRKSLFSAVFLLRPGPRGRTPRRTQQV